MAAPHLNNSHQQIISVGIIGSSNHAYSKNWVCQQLISNHITTSLSDDDQLLHDPFEWIRTFQSASKNDKCSQKSMLSIYDDTDSGTIYFNLKSHTDLSHLTTLLTTLNEQKSHYEFHRILQKNENIYLKSLIFTFVACHHILLFQATTRFNPQWLSIFHFLQEIKLKLLAPMIDILSPLINHIVSTDDTPQILSFLSQNNLCPFIVPVLTFLCPQPMTNGYIALDPKYSQLRKCDLRNGNAGLIDRAVMRKFRARLQQQIVVLLRRCHAVFPYFQTNNHSGSDGDNGESNTHKYSSLSEKELFECIDELRELGFDTMSFVDEEIYSTHSRWIETDDMMHCNPLSLFSLLPNKFVQIYEATIIENINFLFGYHKMGILSEKDRNHKGGHSLAMKVKGINAEIKRYLRSGDKGNKESFSDKIIKKSESSINSNNTNPKPTKKCKMPSRILYYVCAKVIYDSLFKNLNELKSKKNKSELDSYFRIYNLFNYDSTHKHTKNKNKMTQSFIEKSYSKMRVNLDIGRLGRYSSLLCRRAYKSARNEYLRDLAQMYPFQSHMAHIKAAMKVYRTQSIGPLREYYCRQLYKEFDEIWRKGGRQACDMVSLTSRACCRPLHSGTALNTGAMEQNESAKFSEDKYSKFGTDPKGHFSGFSSSHACNCGRTVSKREDPFDLYEANIGFFVQKCCARAQWNYHLFSPCVAMGEDTDSKGKERESTDDSIYKSGFHLCNHGGAELYHKQSGISQSGFDRHERFLLRWDIPIPSNVYVFHTHFKQKQQRFKSDNKTDINDENLGLWLSKIRRTVCIAQSKPNTNAYFPCFVGLEFECYRGHRAILDYKQILELERGTSHAFMGSEFPTQNIPLRVPCKQCQSSKYKARHGHGNIINGQLQRAFIVTPPPPIAITAKPIIVSVSSVMSEAVFEFQTSVVLPPSSFLVLRFPYIYFHDGRGLPPDKLVLRKGMLTVDSVMCTAAAAAEPQSITTPKTTKILKAKTNKSVASNNSSNDSVSNKKIVIKSHSKDSKS